MCPHSYSTAAFVAEFAALLRVASDRCTSQQATIMGKRGAAPSDATNASARKRDRKLTLDQQVKKCIDDNFKKHSHEAIYVRLHEGLTLFDRLKRDKVDGRVTFGSTYYNQLKEYYRPPTDVMSALKPRNEHEAISASHGGVRPCEPQFDAQSGAELRSMRTSRSVCIHIIVQGGCVYVCMCLYW